MFYNLIIDIHYFIMKIFSANENINSNDFEWALSYMTVDQDSRSIIEKHKQYVKGPIFGCSSSNGVFTPYGFKRGAYFLAAKKEDNIQIYPVIKMAMEKTAYNIAKMAALEIKKNFGIPDIILLHSTPGFEERIIEGIIEIFGQNMPVYGGSAADDNLNDKWFIFKDSLKLKEGFLMTGIRAYDIYNNFISGYLPTAHSGILTKVKSRIVYEIDNRPAAIVYNEWTGGLIDKFIGIGGVISTITSLYPIGRYFGEDNGQKIFLLSHPCIVLPQSNSIHFFTELKEGDKIWLMHENKEALVNKVKLVAQNACKETGRSTFKGGILIYCDGIIRTISSQANIVTENYSSIINNAPFIGAATAGEQGFFKGNVNRSSHGNLMINTVIFT